MQETQVPSLSWEDPLKTEMATHSSILAWRIPWTEKPGGLQSIELLRVGHDWATSLSLFTFMHWRSNGNPLQCSCLENPRDGGAWWAAVYGVAQSWTRLKWLSSSSSSSRVQYLLPHHLWPFNPFLELQFLPSFTVCSRSMFISLSAHPGLKVLSVCPSLPRSDLKLLPLKGLSELDFVYLSITILLLWCHTHTEFRYTHIHMYTQTHTHVHTYAHTHTHTQTHTSSEILSSLISRLCVLSWGEISLFWTLVWLTPTDS